MCWKWKDDIGMMEWARNDEMTLEWWNDIGMIEWQVEWERNDRMTMEWH